MNPIDRGIEAFNQARWWDAHERWEQPWRFELAGGAKKHLQSRILACGAFFLVSKGRHEPAGRLARRALQRLSEAGDAVLPRVEIPGLAALLEELARDPASPGALERAALLRARLVS